MTLIQMPDLEQGSDEWHAARRGIVTASIVGRLLSISKPGAQEYDCPDCGATAGDPCISKTSKTTAVAIKTLHAQRTAVAAENAATAPAIVKPATGDDARNVTLSLVAERITNWTEPTWISYDMQRGIDDEPRARDLYSRTYEPVTQTGFMIRDDWGFPIGYSPDGVIKPKAGLIEVKSRNQKVQLATVLDDAVPTANMAQLQCGLLVSGDKWVDYISYSGGMAMWMKRVYPDQMWFDAIVEAVRLFEKNAAEMIRTYNERTAGLPMTERVLDIEEMVI